LGPSKSYGSWIYNCLCNQCLSPLMLWVRISIRVGCTTLRDKVFQWLATGLWFSLGPRVSSTNKTDCHDRTEILLKVALNTIKPTNQQVRSEQLLTNCDNQEVESHLNHTCNAVLGNIMFYVKCNLINGLIYLWQAYVSSRPVPSITIIHTQFIICKLILIINISEMLIIWL
jgi:hypothetical protein